MRNLVSEIQTVKEMRDMVDFLAKRPVEHVKGLGMIYGHWALGKTYFPQKMAMKYGWIYYQLEKTDSTRSFLLKLYDRIYFSVHNEPNILPVRASASTLLQMCMDMLSKNPKTIILDEIDYAISNRTILETIKTIVDKTFSEIIMIGMDDSRKRLYAKAPYIHSRVCYWVEAKHLSLKDVTSVINDICEIELESKLIGSLHKKYRGTLRDLIKEIHSIENVAIPAGIKKLTYDQYFGVEKEKKS